MYSACFSVISAPPPSFPWAFAPADRPIWMRVVRHRCLTTDEMIVPLRLQVQNTLAVRGRKCEGLLLMSLWTSAAEKDQPGEASASHVCPHRQLMRKIWTIILAWASLRTFSLVGSEFVNVGLLKKTQGIFLVSLAGCWNWSCHTWRGCNGILHWACAWLYVPRL